MKTKMASYTLDTLPPMTDARFEELMALSERPDSEIDFSDSPEVTDERWKKRHLLTLRQIADHPRLDSDVLHWLKSQGKGCG
jgi:uncharacterized protein (DUF4415 family)